MNERRTKMNVYKKIFFALATPTEEDCAFPELQKFIKERSKQKILNIINILRKDRTIGYEYVLFYMENDLIK